MVCDILNLIDSTRKNAINLNKKNIYNHPPHLKPYFMAGEGISSRNITSSAFLLLIKHFHEIIQRWPRTCRTWLM